MGKIGGAAPILGYLHRKTIKFGRFQIPRNYRICEIAGNFLLSFSFAFLRSFFLFPGQPPSYESYHLQVDYEV